ncbi:class I SAM-dependent methyltransferase [Cognatilysobacter bugurensis]|uniref:class I SAM-dependent methyltransferase n=1 Tax=Cognatilysobacter bugurensis TaxID=543356 RepID=UPI00167B24E3|nr:methyltransferase domain-containing protein [Lysobacter bugurensis]
MPGFSTRDVLLDVSGQPYRLRVLTDLQQFGDPDGHAAALGISSAQWSLFGQVWPAGQRLAEAMHGFDFAGKRILELGCGIGLASLVLQRRGADVVASDIHPQAEPFLAYNAALNALPAVHYRQLRWDVALPTLGRFDVIIASDVLYERGQVELIAEVIERCAQPAAEVVVTDPGRGHSARLTARLATDGFVLQPGPHAADRDAPSGDRVRTLHYRREAA